MYGDETSARDSAIAALFSRCSSQFRNFYAAIVCKDRQTHQINLARLTGEFGRLGGWGGNSGADRMGRGSLDEKVRNDQNLKSVILNLLEDLYDTLERVTFLAMDGDGDDSGVTSDRPQAGGRDPSSSSVQSSDAEYSSSDESFDSSDDYRSARPRKSEMTISISLLYRQIQLLYNASRNIRRPDIHDMYIPSASETQNASYIAEFDQISERTREWALDSGHPFERPIRAQYLVSRLAFANAKRRKQLRFWREHPGQPVRTDTEPAVSTGDQLAALVLLADTFSGAATPPAGTEVGFSGETKLVLIGAGESTGSSRTAGEPPTHGRGYLDLLDIHHPRPGRLAFDCPLCFSELEVDIQEWREHVFSDLRPYVCTFEKCLIPGKLYPTQDDWLSHEMQIHRRRWVCESGCNSSFNTKEGLEKHMREGHEGEFVESKLPTLLKMSECQADPDEATNCPLCPKASRLYDLQDHLATHMEDLACLVLPSEVEDLVRGPELAAQPVETGAEVISQVELFDADDAQQSQPATSAESAHTAKLPKEIDQGTLWQPTPLQEAAAGGQMHLVDTLLRAGAEVNAPAEGQGGRTALQAAAGGGYLHIAERLLNEGAEVNAPAAEIQGRTAIQAAAEIGNLPVVEYLLKEGAEFNSPASHNGGRTALQAAAEGGHLPIVERLLREGADVNAKASEMQVGMESIQEATAGDHLPNVECLMNKDARADPLASIEVARTALRAISEDDDLAILNGLLDVTRINAQAPHSRGRAALHAAAENVRFFIARRFLRECNDDKRVPSSVKAFVEAIVDGGHYSTAKSLLDAIKIRAAESHYWGVPARRTSYYEVYNHDYSALEEFLHQVPGFNARPSELLETILPRLDSVAGSHLPNAEYPMDKGGPVRVVASVKGGRTALQAAAEGGHLAIVERLLEEGAEVNAPASNYRGKTALRAAAGGGYLSIVDVLLERGADVDAGGSSLTGGTAAEAAAKGGYTAVFERLRLAGISRHQKLVALPISNKIPMS